MTLIRTQEGHSVPLVVVPLVIVPPCPDGKGMKHKQSDVPDNVVSTVLSLLPKTLH